MNISNKINPNAYISTFSLYVSLLVFYSSSGAKYNGVPILCVNYYIFD